MSESPSTPNLKIGPYSIRRGDDFFVIAGPCVIESEGVTLEIAEELAAISRALNTPIIFKASFDKANRTSIDSYRGPGISAGLAVLNKVKARTGLPVISDIHDPSQAPIAAEVLDMIQIPAFLSRQTDLLAAAARTGLPINLKKGQFQSPEDMIHGVRKITQSGGGRILLTERGSSFGYNDVVADMRSIVRLKSLGYPVVFDATHSAQFPGKGDGRSGGDRRLAPHLARAAVAAGADGVFIETHPRPDEALCDGPNSLYLGDVRALVRNLKELFALIPREEPQAAPNQSTKPRDEDLTEKLRKIKLIIFDVDGVLTGGQIVYAGDDVEIKYFHVRDGHGIKIARRIGLEIALITGRSSPMVDKRARELGIDTVYQGMKDKCVALTAIMEKYGFIREEIAVVGDDIVDIPLMRRAGVSFTVPEAGQDVMAEAEVVTRHRGGEGVAREVIERILLAQGKWPAVMERYFA